MSPKAGAIRPTVIAELVDQLTVTQRLLTRGLAALFEEESASVEQWRILRAVSGDDGRPMGELAAALEIPHPTLTRIVDGLVDSAYLYRTQSSHDRRRVSIHLSGRGKEMLTRLESLAAAHEKALQASHGERAIAELKRALSSIRELCSAASA